MTCSRRFSTAGGSTFAPHGSAMDIFGCGAGQESVYTLGQVRGGTAPETEASAGDGTRVCG